jgi:hypothetical protein
MVAIRSVGFARTSVLALALVGLLLGAKTAHATSFALDAEFDNGTVGTFGTVDVTEETGGDLLFQITLNPAVLGAGADLNEFYFNLPSAITGASISSTDAVSTPYELSVDPSVKGGAGSSFAYGVNFGNGAGANGNGVLQSASFLLAADSDLAISDLLISSSTSGGVVVFFAAHVQGTTFTNQDSETVGSSVPEPAVLSLGGVGLACAALARRRGISSARSA